jgi:hypothetical protein
MDPPQQPKYMDANTMMVINPDGQIKQLFIPIRAVCKNAVSGIPVGTTVFIEAVAVQKEHRLCYRITGNWYPYWCFTLKK